MEIGEAIAREYRTCLFAAFDIYKSNVQYGIESETAEQHVEILNWYDQMLTLPLTRESYVGSPECIKRYLPKIR